MNFDILDEKQLNYFKEKYREIHPLVFQRSIEKAENFNDLFEILEDVPSYPFCWDEENKKWISSNDFVVFDKANEIVN